MNLVDIYGKTLFESLSVAKSVFDLQQHLHGSAIVGQVVTLSFLHDGLDTTRKYLIYYYLTNKQMKNESVGQLP